MINYVEEKIKTEIKAQYDVIVVGAGPAGCGTALSCARGGLKTLLIEKNNCLGGMWTTGFMNPLFDWENKDGILKEIISDLKNGGNWGGFWNESFNYEYMKYILDQKFAEAGADVLLNTFFSKSISDGKNVKGVIVENIEGRAAYTAKYTVDCTADGSVAASAGCEFEIGNSCRDYKKCQPMTLMFLVGNIPEKYKDGLLINDILKDAYKKADKDIPFTMPYLIPVPNSRFGVVQFTHMYGYNPLSAKDIGKATVEGRRQMIEAFEALTKYNEDFKDLDLIFSSSVLGVRESRRILGEYRISDEDIMNGAKFDDSLATASFNVDIHTKDNKGQICTSVKPYDIPLRALIPKDYDGICTAGRCISGSQNAMASYRVTGNCIQMGDSLGQILAYAVKNDIDLRTVNAKDILKNRH